MIAATSLASSTLAAAAKRRIAASSAPFGPTGPNGACVLAWLGASTPSIHFCHEVNH